MTDIRYPLDKESHSLIEQARKNKQTELGMKIPKSKFTKFWLAPKIKRIIYTEDKKVNAKPKRR